MFRKEHELVSAFSSKSDAFLKALLNKSVSRSFLLHEFDSYFGVADVVLGVIKASVARQTARKPLNPNWLVPLAAMKRGTKVSVSDFQKTYSLSKSGATKRLTEYEDAGFLVKLEAQTYKVAKEYKPVADFVVSIEAKLRNWQKALVQAQRYRRFSDYSFVLLDGAQAASAIENLSSFEERNIGLVSLSADKLNFHFIPEKNERKISEYYLRVNEVAYDQFISAQTSC